MNTYRKLITKRLLKVAQKFWGSQGAGILFVCQEDSTCLLTLRSASVNEPGSWGVPGGAVEQGEQTEEAARREVQEELGNLPSQFQKIDQTIYNENDFSYTTFVYAISLEEKRKWTKGIRLNWENDKVAWFDLSSLPTNLHFGVKNIRKTLEEQDSEVRFSEPVNKWDELRNSLIKIQKALPKQERSSLQSLIDELLQTPQYETREDIENLLGNTSDKISLLSIYLSQKQDTELKDASEKLQRLSEEIKPDRDRVEKSLISNKQVIDKYLYHGTDLASLLSLLKSKQFSSTGTYHRVSLTTNFDLALKFGDAVISFDAQKMLEKGAVKMQYGNAKEVSEAMDQGRDEDSVDHPLGPIISDIYEYEQEYCVKTPFNFSFEDISKIYFVCDPNRKYGPKQNTSEEVMGLISEITNFEIPVVCSNLKMNAPFYPDPSSRVSPGASSLKSIFFQNILQPFSEIQNMRMAYYDLLRQIGAKESDLSRDPFLSHLNSVLSQMREFQQVGKSISEGGRYSSKIDDLKNFGKAVSIFADDDGSSYVRKLSVFDFDRYKYYFDYSEDDIEKIKLFIESFNDYVKDVKNKMNERYSEFKESAAEYFYSDQEQDPLDHFYKVLFSRDFYDIPKFILDKVNQQGEALFDKIYKDFAAGYLLKYSRNEEYAVRSRIEDLARKVNPEVIPEELLKSNPIILIDHENPGRFTDAQVKAALQGQETYNADWVFKYRFGIREDSLDEAKSKFLEYSDDIKKEILNSYDLSASNKASSKNKFFERVYRVLGRQDLINKIKELVEFIKNDLENKKGDI
jgi:8-oxo-dGTP pyrophosphatase MutT (NUDIX family)